MVLPLSFTRSLQSTAQSSVQAARPQHEKLVRVSRKGSLYAKEALPEQAASTDVIAPVYPTSLRQRRGLVSPQGLTFSGQLLELGLKHNVDGLVQRAPQQLSYDGAKPVSPESRAAARYEKAQGNFARDSLALFAREC